MDALERMEVVLDDISSNLKSRGEAYSWWVWTVPFLMLIAVWPGSRLDSWEKKDD